MEGLSDEGNPASVAIGSAPSCYAAASWRSSGNALGVLVVLESGEKVIDKLYAAGCSDATCQEQGFGGGGRGGLGFLQIEVARGTVGEEHPAGLVPGRGQQAFAFSDQPVSAADVAEVQEGLAGVHGEIGFGYPGAPGGPVGAGVAEVFLCRGKGAQHGASFAVVASCGEGAGEA